MKKFKKICIFTSALMMAMSMNIPAVSAVEFQPVSLVSQKTEIDYQQQATTLMGALDYIDKIGGGSIPLDMDTAFTDDNGYEFAKVTGTQFSSTSDLREYMESVLTKKFINNRYSCILDTSNPMYIDYKGELYGSTGAKGCGFGWTDKQPEIINITSTSFTIMTEYSNYGEDVDYMAINAVLDNGLWKIDSIVEFTQTAYTLMGALNYVDCLGGGGISLDMDTAFTDDNGNEFAKVTETEFSSTSDLREYMESVLTKKFINNRYSDILDNSNPKYIDYKGELYGNTGARGCGFGWTDRQPAIIDITSTSFTIVAEYINYGEEVEYMTINAVLDDGLWKIDSIVECTQTAYILMGALNYVDCLGGGGISLDMDTAFTDDNGNEFAKVTGTQFSSTSHLREYMESVLTKKFINNRYSCILDTSNPMYIDYNGELYGKTGARGCGFGWTDKQPEIIDITSTSFTVSAEYSNYGEDVDYMLINAVLDDGLWKIDSISDTTAVSELSGDANCDGKVSIADAVAIAAYVGNPQANSLSAQGLVNASVQGSDNKIDANDCLAIQQYIAKIVSKLPL